MSVHPGSEDRPCGEQPDQTVIATAALADDLKPLWEIAEQAIGSDWTHDGNGWVHGLLDGISAFDVAALNPHAELSDEAMKRNAEFIVAFQPRAIQDLLVRLAKAEGICLA